MPYYCTVPRCTSMAGKAKNVSFHQFPKDEELANLWNEILKRGKPYTKYSKVCSLHFRPEDYTMNSVGNKKAGQWRSLRKDAVPSQNLPSESPAPYHQRRSSCSQLPTSLSPSLLDPQLQHQFAQAIYMQTMLAMQAATFPDTVGTVDLSIRRDRPEPPSSSGESSDHEPPTANRAFQPSSSADNTESNTTSYKCQNCSKCFKDPDVFFIHQRSHTKESSALSIEKENVEMLATNPILANLLKPTIPDTNAMESQFMTAMALSMQAYVKNFNTILSKSKDDTKENECGDVELNESAESNRLVIDETA